MNAGGLGEVMDEGKPTIQRRFSRRQLLAGGLGVVGSAFGVWQLSSWRRGREAVFIAKAASYEVDLASVISSGLAELGIGVPMIQGRSVLLKPNLVETYRGSDHINTHPLVVRGAAEAFLRLGATRVLVAEAAGHRRDSLLVLEESGMGEALREDGVPFTDLNYEPGFALPNQGRQGPLASLTFPETLRQVDWIVSMPKLKTHHWAGVTLSMKNLFGVMPGLYYGWPKNVLHWAGIEESILDITATLQPHFAIADGIVGMEGDGPIMGTPRYAGVIVMGSNLPAVDATCTRIMGLNPRKIPHLARADDWLGPIGAHSIEQRGEPVSSVRTHFALLEAIPAHRELRQSTLFG